MGEDPRDCREVHSDDTFFAHFDSDRNTDTDPHEYIQSLKVSIETNHKALVAVRAEAIRVRGLVQGVGFRPTVWRIARDLGLVGSVCNDGDGVFVRVWAEPSRIDAFCERLITECPPLGRIDAMERRGLPEQPMPADFVLIAAPQLPYIQAWCRMLPLVRPVVTRFLIRPIDVSVIPLPIVRTVVPG